LPHQKAECIASSVNSSHHVILTLCGDVSHVQVRTNLFLKSAEKGEGRWIRCVALLVDECVGEGRGTRFEEQVDDPGHVRVDDRVVMLEKSTCESLLAA
jgi:hypothetical protein